MYEIFLIILIISTIFLFGCVLTLFKALFRLTEKIEELEGMIEVLEQKKINKPISPPNVVPLELM